VSCYLKHAVLPDIVGRKEKHFVKFNKKEKKRNSSWSLKLVITQTCAILRKHLNLSFPVQGNGCMEIIAAFCPKGFVGIVHKTINSTAPSPLLLTLKFLNFLISTPLLFFFYWNPGSSVQLGSRTKGPLLACTPAVRHLHLQNPFCP